MMSAAREGRCRAIVSILLVAVTLIAAMGGCCGPGNGVIAHNRLYISSSVGGSVIGPGEGSFAYVANTTVDLVAEPDDHHHFVNWTGDVATIGNVNSAATNITMYDSYSITANFELDPGWYSLTISSEGGSVTTPGEGYYVYAASTTADLVAEPDEGYPFLKWAGDVGTIADTQAAATNITMYDSYSITAHFGIQIWDWYDLDAMRDNLGGRYYLMNNLDSTTPGYQELASPTANGGKGWEPVGIRYDEFTGTFDGQECEIHDLFIYRPAEEPVGLFGMAALQVFRDVGVMNVTVAGLYYVGSLAGDCVGMATTEGTLSNCYSSGTVTGVDFVGGLVGGSYGIVSDCYSTASVTGNSSIGGLLGVENGPVSNCYSAGDVSGDAGVGGLVGESYGPLVDCYSTGAVIGSLFVGGLVGGSGFGDLNGCYSTGSVAGHSFVGGLVGDCGLDVRDSYSTSSVSGSEDVGGLVGYCDLSGSVSDCYSTGRVTGNEGVGGLVGLNPYNRSVENSFWDLATSGQTESAGGVGKTTAKMQDIATFLEATWDIVAVIDSGTRNPTHVWNIVNGLTYPFLSWQS